VYTRAECALRDHPALGRYVRQTKTGRLVIDRAKIAAEERLDGKFLLSTSDPDLSAEDVALGYKNLLEAEHGFRDLKTTLELRPVFHRLEHRIRAHVLLSWLALLLIRVAERQTNQTWRRIATELGRLHLVTLTGPTGTIAHTTELTDTQRELFAAPASSPRRGSPPFSPRKRRSAPLTAWAHTHKLHKVPKRQCPRAITAKSRAHQLRNSGTTLASFRARSTAPSTRRIRMSRSSSSTTGQPTNRGTLLHRTGTV
jgi:hypothetical protein